jgi:N-glycosylase/DNA lyase
VGNRNSLVKKVKELSPKEKRDLIELAHHRLERLGTVLEKLKFEDSEAWHELSRAENHLATVLGMEKEVK